MKALGDVDEKNEEASESGRAMDGWKIHSFIYKWVEKWRVIYSLTLIIIKIYYDFPHGQVRVDRSIRLELIFN